MATLQTSLLLLVLGCFSLVVGEKVCPRDSSGTELTCAVQCCRSLQNQGYYCCGVEDNQIHATGVDDSSQKGRAERFATYQTAFQVDYTLLVIGLIVSIVVSILLSFLCCLLCNGCWLHRHRNPERYESVNDSGFYPICCGFGIPLGTVVFSTHPPQFNPNNEGLYSSSTSSLPSSRNPNNPSNRVRFNEDGTPRGVLKNGNPPEHYGQGY